MASDTAEALPRLTLANCVVVGSLNPAILQPRWIVEQGILSKGEANIELAAEMAQTAQPLALRFSMAGLAWIPQLSRLEVQAVDESADPGRFVSLVFEKLSHTPVRAVGHNFSFDPGTRAGDALFAITECPPLRGFLAKRQSLGRDTVFRFSHDDGVLNLTLVSSGARVTAVQFNFHREMKDALSASKAAGKWTTDRAQAVQLMQELPEVQAER